jgi:hypothetical protein
MVWDLRVLVMSDGRCLSNAFSEMAKRDRNGEKVVYVQATVIHPTRGVSFKHAWVENRGNVIDPTIDLITKKPEYYARFQPKDIIRLDPFTATMLFTKEMKFVTPAEVKKMQDHIKVLDAKFGKKTSRNP